MQQSQFLEYLELYRQYDPYFIAFFLFLFIIFAFGYYMNLNKNKKLFKEEIKEIEETHEIDFQKVQAAEKILDNLIKTNFKVQFYLEFLPVYLDKKVPEKSLINKAKQNIYISVIGKLTPDYLKILLSVYNKKGLEMLIHEKILVMINELDYSFSERKRNGGISDEINIRNISDVLPIT